MLLQYIIYVCFLQEMMDLSVETSTKGSRVYNWNPYEPP